MASVHVVVHALALVVFEVGQRRGLHADVEAPALVVAEGNPYERHLPAVQVTCYGDRRGGQLVAHDVVTAGEGYTHLWRDVDTAVESDGLRDVAPVSGGSVVDVAYRIADHVVESDIPRHREVVVCLRHVLPSQYGVHRAVGIVERVDVFWRYGVEHDDA